MDIEISAKICVKAMLEDHFISKQNWKFCFFSLFFLFLFIVYPYLFTHCNNFEIHWTKPCWPSVLEHHYQMFYTHAQGRGFESRSFRNIYKVIYFCLRMLGLEWRMCSSWKRLIVHGHNLDFWNLIEVEVLGRRALARACVGGGNSIPLCMCRHVHVHMCMCRPSKRNIQSIPAI